MGHCAEAMQAPPGSQADTEEGVNQWPSGLFACHKDCGVCCFGMLCMGCANAYARSKYDESNFLYNLFGLSPCLARNIIREGNYDIEGSCLSDVCIPLWCTCCSVCQVLREVNTRGAVNNMSVYVKDDGEKADGVDKDSEGSNDWSSPVHHCFDDMGGCVYTCCCPQCAAASARTGYDGSTFFFNVFWVAPCMLRNIIREGQYDIQGSCLGDIYFAFLSVVLLT